MAMLRTQRITTRFAEGDRIAVIDGGHLYANHEGVVVRIGSAGDIIYVHCQLHNVLSVIAFRESQIEKVR